MVLTHERVASSIAMQVGGVGLGLLTQVSRGAFQPVRVFGLWAARFVCGRRGLG